MNNQNTTPGFEAATDGFSSASKSIQTFTSEMARMSRESVEHTTQLVEKLRGAKTVEDVISVQTAFMQRSFSNYADYTRRFGELLTTLPLELAKHGRNAMQHGAEAVAKQAEQTGQHVQHAGEQFQQAAHDHDQGGHNQNYDHDRNQNFQQNY